MVEKIPMTAAGYTALEEELKHCQGNERPRIIQQITEARSHGDLSENAEYHAAKEQQSLNEGRIDELQDKLARADIIDVSKLSGDTITFGATVTLIDEDTEEKKVWQIVGEPEANAKAGKISMEQIREIATKKMPDLQPSFDAWVADLKARAEKA
jgi:transcription elongation factor GreA